MKFPSIPKNAAESRGYRNSVYSAICKLSKKDEAEVLQWVSACHSASSTAELPPGKFPVLDRMIGHKLLEAARGTRFSLEFQTLQEAYQKKGKQPLGRALLWTVLQKYKLHKDRGAPLSQHHLLALRIEGTNIKSLVEFKSKFDYCVGPLEQTDMPADSALRSLLFENLKSHPKLALSIDKFREAKSGSSKRTWKWLYQKMEEAIEIEQLDENTGHVEKALQSTGGHKVPANPAKKDAKEENPSKNPKKEKQPKSEDTKKTEKKEKQKSEKQSKEVPAAPGKGVGKGKGKKGDAKPSNPGNQGGKGSAPTLSREEKSKQPCMYFAFDACSKGDKCPYLHDKNNMYKGSKPKPLEETTSAGSATVHAGAARLISGAVAASSVLRAEGVSSHSAPPTEASVQSCVASSVVKACRTWWKRGCKFAKTFSVKGTVKKPLKKFGHHPMLLEKAFKCFAAMAMVCNPVGTTLLTDSGAGRNLISQKMMPEKDCPPAISLGQQVIDLKKPWIWLPDELPYFIKADRVKDVKIEVPEDAKVHATRVVEYVPILEEHVECLAMVGKIGDKRISSEPSGPSSSSKNVPQDVLATDAGVEDDPKTVLEKSRPKELVGDEGGDDGCSPTSPAETPKDMQVEGGPPEGESSEDEGVDAANRLNHSLTHCPKSKSCEICMRAKMTSRYHRRRGDPDPKEEPPQHFGHRLRADHIIVGSDLSKGSEGEQACLICLEE